MSKDQKGRHAQVLVSGAHEKTRSQVDVLLRVVHELTEFVSIPADANTNAFTYPTEVKEKAGKSLEFALHQLDNVLNDMNRWTAAPDAHEEALADAMHAQAKASLAEAAKNALVAKPHLVYGAHLHRLDDGDWGAFYVPAAGDASALLVGRGGSPVEALDDFDNNFSAGRVLGSDESVPTQTDEATGDDGSGRLDAEQP